MSSTNKLQKVSGKRKHNELVEQDADVQQHQHSSQDASHLKKGVKKHSSAKHSEKRKRDESMDEEDGDEVTKKPKHHHHHHHSASKNQDHIDDDEEEEDYDDEEDEELKDFIAQDDEVEYEEDGGASQESGLNRQGDSQTERRRRKKKNREPRQLDEEDFDLIEENTGKEVKKKKRLQRVADQEKKALQISDDEDKPQVNLVKEDDDDAQYFDNEINDTNSRKRLITSANRRIPVNSVDAESAQLHQKIFGDSSSLGAKVKQNQRAAATLKDKSNVAIDETLEGVYDADELDDQFATKADLLIMKTDIPERLQIRIGDRLEQKMGTEAFREELDHEVDYIFDNLEPLLKDKPNYYNEDSVIKSKIKQILVFLRSKRYVYDVPMIAKYRNYEYNGNNTLQEEHIQVIANLDVEYGKFRAQLQQVVDFFNKLLSVLHDYTDNNHVIQSERDVILTHLRELQRKCKSFSDLQTYQPIVQFYKQYYKSELEQEQLKETQQPGNFHLKALPRVRSSYDQIDSIKSNGLSNIARQYFISPLHFIENFTTQMLQHKPPATYAEVEEKFLKMDDDIKRQSMNQTIIKFAAIELSVQPFIRKKLKQFIYQEGYLKTYPTEEGKKVLDPFHQSYRAKHIEGIQLQSILNEAKSARSSTLGGMDSQIHRGDLFLDVLQNEKRQLINVEFEIKESDRNSLINSFCSSYQSSEEGRYYNENIVQTLKILINDILIPEISKEIRNELSEASENYVIKYCQEVYQDMLMVGPYQGKDPSQQQLELPSLTHQASTASRGSGRVKNPNEDKKEDSFYIPDRPRSVVMGIILHQVDSQNQIVTVAIIDKYGEVLNFDHFNKLLPPREFKPKSHGSDMITDEEDMRRKKMQLLNQEEKAEHQKDRDRIIELIRKYEIDLIVVGANKLEARLLKQTLDKIAEHLSGADINEAESQLQKASSKESDDKPKMDVFVTWGNLDVPKLFANSHISQKLLKGYDQTVKQAVSLARYQQDPMNEILNLWSFVIQENQALNLNLHPHQKMVNQAKLQEALEDSNVACVCAVGVDINLLINHDHMHILLSFISGFGPRKAKHFIQTLKKNGSRILTRVEIYKNDFLQKACFISSVGFLKVRIAPEDLGPQQQIELLSMTRIHIESYNIAIKVACDTLHEDGDMNVDMDINPDNLDSDMSKQRTAQQMKAINGVFKRPELLQTLDIQNYKQTLIVQGQGKMVQLIEMIVQEIKNPFKDPRIYKTKVLMPIPAQKLLPMLIEETEQTFRRGIIVTAQVIRVIEKQDSNQSFVLCKLDNGLDAKIDSGKLDLNGRRLEEVVQSGQVLTGRIDEIRDKEEAKFGVQLTCKRVDLENHANFLPEGIICQPEDLINQAFKIDKEGGANGQRKFHMRRINHPKFKNINSQKAVELLKGQEYGEFIFRPSSKGPDNITLTWKFYNNNIVHIDIQEYEKAIGASIGSKLQIGKEELFENLQEIVERYIAPCNKFMREAAGHIKFNNCTKLEEFDELLKAEKNSDPARIPYRFTVLEEYPQHLVLGYIPKMSLVKEFIKIKPKGYHFHDQVHKQLQSLINWFKDNYRQRDYIRYQKKQLSPRARAPEAPKAQQQDEQEEQKGWNNFQWNQAGKGQSPLPEEFGGASSNTDWQQVSRGIAGPGRGSSSGPRSCFKCGETTHLAKDCTNPSQERRQYGSGSVRGGRGGRDDSMRRGGNRDQDMSEPAGGSTWNNQPPSPKMEAPQWGAAANSAHQENIQWGGGGNNDPPTSQGWGGSSHHGDVEMRTESRGAGWGNSDAGAGNTDTGASGWGGQSNSGGFDNNQDDDQGRTSRGRGRGGPRGGGFGDNNRGGPSGDRTQSNKCFKCGEEGHFSRDCPNLQPRGPGGNAGGGNRGCFKCQQEGHMARDCPNQSANDSKGRGRGRGGQGGSGGAVTCYKCKQEGHISRDCQNEGAGGSDQPYKRQRRDDDGGSFRRPGGDDNGGGASNSWGDNKGGANQWPDNKNSGNNADANQWGASSSAKDTNANAWGTNAEAQQTPNDAGGW